MSERAPKLWHPDVCAAMWERTRQTPPTIDRDGYREWSIDGAIYTKAPQRAVVCAACGLRIPKGTESLYVIDSLNGPDPWAPARRYLHMEPCIPGSDS